LKEKGAEEFSNIKGLTYISFKKAKIAEAFAEIDRALVRERVIAAPNPTAKGKLENWDRRVDVHQFPLVEKLGNIPSAVRREGVLKDG
jgi:hypothetical protein